MMRLESSYDMGDPREITCSSGTMELMGETDRKTQSMRHKLYVHKQELTASKPKYEYTIPHTHKDIFANNLL